MAGNVSIRVQKDYFVRTLDLPGELKPRLDELSLASGELYSQVVVTFWRYLRRSAGKGKDPRRRPVFLNSSQLQQMFPSDSEKKLHSHTCDAIVQQFDAAIKAARTRKKKDPNARFPKRRTRYNRLQFKSSAIRIRDGKLLLSTGDRKRPIEIDWSFELPTMVEIGWKQTGGYQLRAVYEDTRPVLCPLGDRVAGVDIGELRVGAVYDGDSVELHSGRLIRARNHYANKNQARLDTAISHKKNVAVKQGRKKSSKRLKRLQRARRNLRARIKRQNRDQITKQARRIVSTLRNKGVQTVAVGDCSDIRSRIDFGKVGNQKLHAWMSLQFVQQLKSQARKMGLRVEMVDESYTSKTCPWTGIHRKPKGRNFVSPDGVHSMDRDGVGAVNIRAKYLETVAGQGSAYGHNPGLPWTPVLVGMAPTTRGVRFSAGERKPVIRVSRMGGGREVDHAELPTRK